MREKTHWVRSIRTAIDMRIERKTFGAELTLLLRKERMLAHIAQLDVASRFVKTVWID